MLQKWGITNSDKESESGLDEGWWSAILYDEEEEKYSSTHESSPKENPQISGSVNWEYVRSLFEQDEIVILQVQGHNRGGLLVQGQGVQGFVPISHLVESSEGHNETDRKQWLAGFMGRFLHLKVIECEPTQERVVLSERAALAGEGRRKQLFESLKVGDVVEGVVTNVTDFGAFVDLGGVEGLIHVSELSWGRVQHPADFIRVGDHVNTVVLQISQENSRVALSLKRLTLNPWDELSKNNKPGDVMEATITDLMRFGAFARLQVGVEGLIHISSITMPAGVRNLDEVLEKGQKVHVKILHIDSDRRRLGLGLVSFE